jgi:hypothetical protein
MITSLIGRINLPRKFILYGYRFTGCFQLLICRHYGAMEVRWIGVVIGAFGIPAFRVN